MECMAQIPHEFRAKTWILIVSAFFFGGIAAFGILQGALFLTGAEKRADGRPATDAGIALCIFGVVFGLIAAITLVQVILLRRPLLRLCREGILFYRVAPSPFDDLARIVGFQKAFALLGIVWMIVSLQGFKRQRLHILWEAFRGAEMSGMTMQRRLVIFGSVFLGDAQPPAPIADCLVFEEVAFVTPLDKIAHAVTRYAEDAPMRQRLPSWND